jgi:hypothetical protein
MAIDYIIDYDCVPKQTLTTEGIIERLKGKERAEAIIQLYRDKGDQRPPSQMGFEFSRSTPEGVQENRVIVVQDLLDAAAELTPLDHHCANCPANRRGKPFGCINFIQYPISAKAEGWLLDRLPVPDDALIWLLLKQGVEEFKYDGSTVQALRAPDGSYFDDDRVLVRRLGEFEINSNQVFEMIFSVGNIIPNHAALLLLFFHVIRRDLEASEIMGLTPAPDNAREAYPFLLELDQDDNQTIAEFKHFFDALYHAWLLNRRLLIDA